MPTNAEVSSLGDATTDQRSELRALIAERTVDEQWRQRFYRKVRAANGLTYLAANDALTYLRSLAPKGHQPTHATPDQGVALRGLMRARLVPARLRKVLLARLDAGQMTYVEADRAIREWLEMPLRPFLLAADVERRSGWKAPDGYFALLRQDGTPRCYRVHTMPATGARVVEQIKGDRRNQRTKVYGHHATVVLREIAADPAGAARRYARARNRCAACNQHIGAVDQPGYEAGFGEDCWRQRQAAAT